MKAYLAGPDVFLPNAVAHAAAKIAICARHGLTGRAPVGDEIGDLSGLAPEAAWRAIYQKDLAMMEDCDIIIANLTPFRGASADAGTLVELGWFLGRGKPVFGYSNSATLFGPRSRAQVASVPDPVQGLLIEDFGQSDNLMIQGALVDGDGVGMVLPPDGLDRAFDALDVFERCVAATARKLGLR